MGEGKVSNKDSQLVDNDTVSLIINKFRQEHCAGNFGSSKVKGANNTEPLGNNNANTAETQLKEGKERTAVEELIEAIKMPEIYNKYNNSLSILEKWCLLSRSICYFLAAFFSGQGWNMAVFAFRLEQASEFLNKFINDAVGVNKLVVNDLSQKILHAKNNEEKKEATRILEYYSNPVYLVSNLPKEILESNAFIEIVKLFSKHRDSVIKNGLENLRRNKIPSEDFIKFLQKILEKIPKEKHKSMRESLDFDVKGCLEQILFLQLNSKLKIINEEKNKDIPSLEFINLLKCIPDMHNNFVNEKFGFNPKEKLSKICDCVQNHLMFEEKTEDNKEITRKCFEIADAEWDNNGDNAAIYWLKLGVQIKQDLGDNSPIIDKKIYDGLESIFKECICTAISQYLQEKANNENTWENIKHEWEEKQPKDVDFIKEIASAIEVDSTSELSSLCSRTILKNFPNALTRPENSDLLEIMSQLNKNIAMNEQGFEFNIAYSVIIPSLGGPYGSLMLCMKSGEIEELLINIENAYNTKHHKDGANEA